MLLTLLLALAIDGGLCANNTFGGPDDSAIEAVCLNSRFDAVPLAESTGAALTACANEGGFCTFDGTQTVTYGVLGVATTEKQFTNGVACNNEMFGDPLHGHAKQCFLSGGAAPAITSFDYPCVNYTGPFKEFAALGLAPNSPARGAGAEIAGFTCPAPGHPGDGNCLEWFNVPGPDIGACQSVYLSKSIVITLEANP